MVNPSGIASSLKRRISAETIVLTALAVLIVLGLYFTSLYNYLLFHGIIKCACIGIAITIYVIIWNTRRRVVDTFLLIVAVSFLFCGFFELLHMLTFNGMGVFSGNTENLTNQIWIAGRYFQSVTLCLAVFFFGKTLTKDQKDDFTIFVTLGAVITLFLLGSIVLWQIFPACFIPGAGPTLFFVASEYIIALFLFAAIALLLVRRTSFDREVWQFLAIALVFLAASELAFTLSVNEYSFINTTGHLFTLFSYYFFYRAIVVVAIRRPADLIFRRLKEDEEALQESESRYRVFFSTSLDGVYMTSREGKLLDFNDSLLRILGYDTREELKNIDSRSMYAEAHERDLYTRTIDKEGYIREYPFKVKKKDGTLIDTLVSARPLKDHDGKIIGYQGSVRDVTFQKRAEAALRESEERYRTLFEESPVALWEEDFSAVKSWMDAKSREGITDWTAYFKEHPEDLRRCASLVRIVHFNHATTALYGITTVLELTSGLTGIFTEESYESFREEIVCFAEKKYTCESERPLQTLNKKRIVTLIRAAVVPGFEATLAKVLVTVIDITELKKAEAALRESEERYRSIIENIRDVSYRIDKEDRLVMVSPSGAQTFGYASPATILGRPVMLLWKHPEQRLRFIRSMREQGGTVQDWEAEFIKKDGTAFWVSISSHLLTDEKGEYAGSEGIIRDITERKKMDAALKNALNKLNMLSSITRHDIQNQLLALRGYLELSRKTVADKTLLDMIDKEDAIAETIGKQIEFSKYYENIGVNAPAWHDLGTMIQSACSQLQQLAGITVSTSIPAVEIYADALIGKVIYNFLENSLRHGVKVTRIDFSFHETDDGAVIIYEDNGIGILPQDRPSLFRKGFGKHTGLGLFLSQQILAITGLTIRETGEIGKGVRFEILVPKGEYRIKSGL